MLAFLSAEYRRPPEKDEVVDILAYHFHCRRLHRLIQAQDATTAPDMLKIIQMFVKVHRWLHERSYESPAPFNVRECEIINHLFERRCGKSSMRSTEEGDELNGLKNPPVLLLVVPELSQDQSLDAIRIVRTRLDIFAG